MRGGWAGMTVALAGAAAAVTSCGVSELRSGSAPDDAGPSEDASAAHAVPPAPDPNAPTASGPGLTVAIQQLDLGDSDTEPGSSDWMSVGFDLDGQWSTPNSTAHCRPYPGAPRERVITDGEGGIDNSFGPNLLPLVESLSQDVQRQVDDSIHSGHWTLLLRLENLGPEPSQNRIDAALFVGVGLEAPRWDGSDRWPIAADSLRDGDLTRPRIVFPDAYLVDNTWVSGIAREPLVITLLIEDLRLPLVVHHARFSARRTSGGLSEGVLGGVLWTDELIDAAWCSEPYTFTTIAPQLRAMSDILADGTQDPSRECNAISIGLAFSATSAKLGDVTPPPPFSSDPCAG